MLKIKKVIAIILLILLSATVFVGCGSNEEQVAVQLTPVEVYNVKTGDVELNYNVFGSIKPLREVSIVPKMAGIVENVMKGMGDRVNKDDVLFTLDKTNLYQQLAQLDAQLHQQLMQAEAAMRQAEIQYYSAKEDYEKNEVLFMAQAISQQMLEAYKKAFELAELQYTNAQDNYYLLQNKTLLGIAEDNSRLTQDTKSIIETQREAIVQMINDSEVKSPISGIVTLRNIEAGEMVSQQIPAFIIVDIDRVEVETEVTERMINNIFIGQELVVSINALNGKEFKGVVDTLSPAVSGQRVGYPVKIIIDNPNHEIKPGMFAEISFIMDRKDRVLVIPMEAVLASNNESYVYVLVDDTVIKQTVEVGYRDKNNLEIIDGLKDGDLVVVKGQHFIVDGERVQPVGGVQ
ncbi:efflux RND transporter periplasmic adaptor subunit [Geosporobacter ferrireducens]|uniref:Uncharacterized protein n=1 Tax=Geosporobacter ferrireducens TaxID=1424294 RepID=A0A1D8GM13_9FIRM|nr:efflux RND transporter periplasmic adaptor subunit [Geosporobacter ferrireducens]AOT71956.1 hypothetical protein Gferi_21890 [Geosporobacter ferrireducens]